MTADDLETLEPAKQPRRTQGSLQLHFEATPDGTILRRNLEQPPLRVIRPFALPDGACLLHLHNVSGGILGGDHLALEATLGENAAVQLTTTSATRVYKSRGNLATQLTNIQLAENALLEYLPDQLIPFAGALYRQQTKIQLADGAGLFWWEVVSPGRESFGELFAYERLELSFAVEAGGLPIVLDRALLEPAKSQLNSPARLGRYPYFASFYICRVGLAKNSWADLEAELMELSEKLSQPGTVTWGASTLAAHGLVIRGLSQTHRALATGLPAFWQLAKLRLYQRTAVLPRKIY